MYVRVLRTASKNVEQWSPLRIVLGKIGWHAEPLVPLGYILVLDHPPVRWLDMHNYIKYSNGTRSWTSSKCMGLALLTLSGE